MTEDQIRQEIKEIKQLIVNQRFKKGFLKLAGLIEEIDRLDTTDTDDVELENQYLMIKSRFETINSDTIQGFPKASEEINQIKLSILQFLDEVKSIAIEYSADSNDSQTGQQFISNPDETIATGVPVKTPEKEEPQDLSFSYSKTKDSTNVKVGLSSANLRMILTFLTVIILGGMAMFFFSDGCNKDPINPTPPVVVDTTEVKPEPKPEPIPLGLNGEALGFENGSAEDELADYLSDPKSSIPSKVFKIIEAEFARNSSRLNASSKHKLDNIAKVLEEYPDAKIDIYGYMADNESASNGNKEGGSLDDARAKAVFNYLKRKGISEDRLNFQGDGLDDKPMVGLRVFNR